MSKYNLEVDYKAPTPVYEQIKQAIKLKIIGGGIAVDEKLESVRGLAKELKVNQNTIIKSYYQLEVEGFVYSRPGLGYFVKEQTDKSSNESKKLLASAADEYIRKITDLGYSLDQGIGELESRKHDKGEKPC